jgi:hypothetical protein
MTQSPNHKTRDSLHTKRTKIDEEHKEVFGIDEENVIFMFIVLFILLLLLAGAIANLTIGILASKRHPIVMRYIKKLADTSENNTALRGVYPRNDDYYIFFLQLTSTLVGCVFFALFILLLLGILDFRYDFNPLGIPFYWGTPAAP